MHINKVITASIILHLVQINIHTQIHPSLVSIHLGFYTSQTQAKTNGGRGSIRFIHQQAQVRRRLHHAAVHRSSHRLFCRPSCFSVAEFNRSVVQQCAAAGRCVSSSEAESDGDCCSYQRRQCSTGRRGEKAEVREWG